MSESQEAEIIRELKRWGNGELGSKLTWQILADTFGFTRKALSDKPNIKAAYGTAKSNLRDGIAVTKEEALEEAESLNFELQSLNKQLENYKEKEAQWQQRWQRIAYHIRKKGIQVSSVDKPIPDGGRVPNKKSTADILRPFDKQIPPSGRK